MLRCQCALVCRGHLRMALPASGRSQDWLQAPEQLLTCYCGSWISGHHWLEQLCWGGGKDRTQAVGLLMWEPWGVISSKIFRGSSVTVLAVGFLIVFSGVLQAGCREPQSLLLCG